MHYKNTVLPAGAAALAALLCLLLAAPASGGWADKLSKVKEALETTSGSSGSGTSSSSSLTSSEIVSGLKTALDKAVDAAVSSLGAEDGFLGNADVKIPVPDSLSKVESGLRLLGQSELADSFVSSMNRAAEQAVPETLDVLGDAISNMSFDDARSILDGGDTAATDYFRSSSDSALLERIEPIVSEAMDGVGVTQNYKAMTSAAQAAGSAVGMDTESLDLDAYVTRKALDGLYFMMEQEEANIRENPTDYASEILKKVFGSAQ
jgi:hypothetical protein